MSDEIRPLFPKSSARADDATPPIIGTILPTDDREAPPFVIKPNDPRSPVACEHREYVLHERWQVVTCGTCGAELAPFAVLQRYAEFSQHLARERQRLHADHAGALVEQLRALAPRVALDDTDRARITALVTVAPKRVYVDAPAWIREAAALRDALERKVWDAQHTRRANKRAVQLRNL